MREPATDSARTDAARVRLVLSRELETISHYEELAAQAESPEVRAFFLHLAAEEKEHVAEAVQVLRKLDPAQNQHFEQDVSAHLTSVGASSGRDLSVGAKPADGTGLSGPLPPERQLYAVPFPPHPPAGTFTVGPLKVRR